MMSSSQQGASFIFLIVFIRPSGLGGDLMIVPVSPLRLRHSKRQQTGPDTWRVEAEALTGTRGGEAELGTVTRSPAVDVMVVVMVTASASLRPPPWR
ncbi:unnamed protein product [Arctogadus glacialis]